MEVLDHAVVDGSLAQGMAWERDGNELVKVRTGRDFADALDYVNAVGALAEEMDHHPDIDIRWNRVTLRLSTHSAGGITQVDLGIGPPDRRPARPRRLTAPSRPAPLGLSTDREQSDRRVALPLRSASSVGRPGPRDR